MRERRRAAPENDGADPGNPAAARTRGGRFLDARHGQTARRDESPGSVIAYVSLSPRFVLRTSSATPAERRDLLGLRPALPAREVVRGNEIDWVAAARR